MGYFPSDIPFMSEDELKENGIKIPKDPEKAIDVYIYKLDLNVGKPVVEKFPAQIREGAYGDEVIRWIGPNDYSVWHSEFDTRMLGVVYEPLDNIIELIVKRDKKESESITMIEDYCGKKAEILRKKINRYYRGISAAIRFMVFKTTKVKAIRPGGPLYGTHATQVIFDDFDPPEIPPVSREEYLKRASFSAPIDVTDDQFDGDPVLIIPGPFEGEENPDGQDV